MLVDASVELGRYDEAAEHLQAMLDVRPDSTALARASYLRELHGDLPGADGGDAAGVERRRRRPGRHRRDRRAARQPPAGEGRPRRGDSVLRALAALAPQRVGAALGLARCSRRGRRPARAIELAAATTDRSPQPAAATLLGELRLAAGDREGADARLRPRASQRAAARRRPASRSTSSRRCSKPTTATRRTPSRWPSRVRRPPDGPHRRRARLGAHPRRRRRSPPLPFVAEAGRFGTASAALHVHAAAALAQAGQLDRADGRARAGVRPVAVARISSSERRRRASPAGSPSPNPRAWRPS